MTRLAVLLLSLMIISLLFTSQGVANIDPETVVGMWLFDEGSGVVASDSSGKGNDGTIIGAEFVDGMFGKALHFNGDGDYVEVEDADSLNPTEKISIVMWIRPDAGMDCDDNNNWRYLITKGLWESYNLIWESDWTFNEVAWTLMIQGISKRLWTTDGAPAGEWIHIGVTYDSKAGSGIFVNGEEDPGKNPEGPDDGPIDISPEVLKIAGGENAGCPDGDGYFAGVIDEVAIFNEVLSEADVKVIMNGGLGAIMVTIEGLIAHKERCFASGGIDNRGVANSLDQKLEAAKAALDRGQARVAVNILSAFINEVEAQSGKHISPKCADLLAGYAGRLISVLTGVPQAPSLSPSGRITKTWGGIKGDHN